MGYGFGVRGRKVKSRDCALASDLVRAVLRSSRLTLRPLGVLRPPGVLPLGRCKNLYCSLVATYTRRAMHVHDSLNLSVITLKRHYALLEEQVRRARSDDGRL